MKSLKSLVIFSLLLTSLSFGQTKWSFDVAHSSIQFHVKHLVISEVTGGFKEFEGSVDSKKNDDFSGAKINFTVKTASVNTENSKRDEHLKSEEFFSSEKFPLMKFEGKSMTKVGKNKYSLVGNLTIREVTKEVKLDVVYNGTVNDSWGNTKSGFKITGQLNRFDYNLKWNMLVEAGSVVGKEVRLECNVELQKAK